MKTQILFKKALFIVILLLFHLCINAQSQIGNDIDGEAGGDESGISVALSTDGNYVAIGAHKNDGNGTRSGQVRVYEWDSNNWVQMGSDLDGATTNDYFGTSVALSSDGGIVAGGAPIGGNSAEGYVQVYEWNGNSWVQLGNDILGEAGGDRFGEAICLSSDGSRIAAGAYLNDGNGGSAGHVRVYDWDGNNWTQLGSDIDGEYAGDQFGSAVALSGDGSHVAIGAKFNDDGGGWSGHTRVYEWNGNQWNQVGNDLDGENGGDRSGASVSLSSDGSRVAIGAINNGGSGVRAGHARIYEWDGGNWNQVGSDIDGEAEEDGSGVAVSLSSDGNYIAIGANRNDGNGNLSGHVRIYEWDGGNWNQVGNDLDGETVGDESGISVALSSDGSIVAIGANENDGNGGTSGHTRIYDLNAPLPVEFIYFRGDVLFP